MSHFCHKWITLKWIKGIIMKYLATNSVKGPSNLGGGNVWNRDRCQARRKNGLRPYQPVSGSSSPLHLSLDLEDIQIYIRRRLSRLASTPAYFDKNHEI
jgi:hypothetical protein